MVKEAISKQRNKKAADRAGWKGEWLKQGGSEMLKSVTYIVNEIEKERLIPEQ